MKNTFPVNYGAECVIIAIDKSLIPLVSGALRPFEQRYSWVSDADYQAGYNAFAEVQAAMANNCLVDLVESNNRLYRLLDTALNGTQYTAAGDVITPAIPTVPPVGTNAPNAMRAHLGRLWHLAENAATGAAYPADSGVDGSVALDFNGSWRARLEAVQGEINELWFGIGGQPARLSDIVAALRIGKPQDAARIDTALEALSAASSSSVVFSTVQDLFADVVSGGIEGATLGTLIAASIASSAQLGILSGQIDRLVAALDGGGLVATVPPPAGTVLGELEAIKVQLQ